MKTPLLFFFTIFSVIVNSTHAQMTEVSQKEKTLSTSITFTETSFDFGEVTEGTLVTHVFTFKNTGNEPFVITSARSSCGCTVPYYPKVAIQPGQSSEIYATFNSANRMGRQQKSITIQGNTTPSITVLKLSGTVIQNDEGIKPEDEKRMTEKRKIETLNPNCFAIYPNPTNSILQLDLKDFIGLSASALIRNEIGQTIDELTIDNISSANTTVDVSSYKPGIYMVTITIKDKAPVTQCFVVTGQ